MAQIPSTDAIAPRMEARGDQQDAGTNLKELAARFAALLKAEAGRSGPVPTMVIAEHTPQAPAKAGAAAKATLMAQQAGATLLNPQTGKGLVQPGSGGLTASIGGMPTAQPGLPGTFRAGEPGKTHALETAAPRALPGGDTRTPADMPRAQPEIKADARPPTGETAQQPAERREARAVQPEADRPAMNQRPVEGERQITTRQTSDAQPATVRQGGGGESAPLPRTEGSPVAVVMDHGEAAMMAEERGGPEMALLVGGIPLAAGRRRDKTDKVPKGEGKLGVNPLGLASVMLDGEGGITVAGPTVELRYSGARHCRDGSITAESGEGEVDGEPARIETGPEGAALILSPHGKVYMLHLWVNGVALSIPAMLELQ